jgi:uncharacterized protein YcbK (DUF882 family)
MDRRSFLKGVLAAAIMFGASQISARADDEGPYTLKMYNTHTGEYMNLVLRDGQSCAPGDMDKVDRFLRCHYNDEVHKMEPGLVGLLARIDRMHGGGNLVHIISGYRSPAYNAILASRSNGVAAHSLHTKGMAVDFMIPGVGMQKLFADVRSLSAGGAGVYPEFVHMDVGRVRTWGHAV